MFNPRPDYKQDTTSALPDQVKYSQLRPQATPGESQIRTFQSVNETRFDPDSNPQARIDVTCGAMGFLNCADGFLNIEIESKGAGTSSNTSQKLDGGIWSVVQKLEILSGGVLLESIDNYNLLHNKVFQYNTAPGDLVKQNATACTSQALVSASSSKDQAKYESASAGFLNTGDVLKGSFAPISGFLSGNKYVPVGSSSQGFTIQLTFATANQCLVTDQGAGGYKINKVQYVAPIVYIRDPAFAVNWGALLQTVGGVSWEGQTYSCLTNNFASATGNAVININEKCKSLNGYMSVIRTASNVNGHDKKSLSCSDITGVSSFQFKVGETYYPPAVINVACSTSTDTATNGCDYKATDISRAYFEVMKMFSSASDHSQATLIGAAQFSATEAKDGSGVVCIDLESYNGDQNTNEKGLNTAATGQLSSLEMTANYTSAMRVDTFAFKTAIYHLDAMGNFSRSQ